MIVSKKYKLGLIYLLLFCFCTWFALATRHHKNWFHPIIVKYGGDIIWAGMFLFFTRIFFQKLSLYKLAIIVYLLGVLDELSQLITANWFVAIRKTALGKLMLGVGFVYSDLICYAIGVLLAYFTILFIEHKLFNTPNK